MIDSVTTRCSASVGAKQSSTTSHLTLFLTRDMWCFCWNVVVAFGRTWHWVSKSNSSTLVGPDVLWFVQMQVCEPQSCLHVLFRHKGLYPGSPSIQTILLLSFSEFAVMDFNIKGWWVTKPGCNITYPLKDSGSRAGLYSFTHIFSFSFIFVKKKKNWHGEKSYMMLIHLKLDLPFTKICHNEMIWDMTVFMGEKKPI